jgi:hypothetical protein
MGEIPLRLIQTIGITTAGILSGGSLSLSFLVIPRLLESPAPVLLSQWRSSFLITKKIFPLATLLASSSFFYLSYVVYSSPFSIACIWQSYLVAGSLALAIVPYTLLFMTKTNKALLDRTKEENVLGLEEKMVENEAGRGKNVHQLVDRWATLNLGRSALLVLATVVGTYTALS